MDLRTERIALNVPDISCGHCVATVKAAVGALPGIAHVDADPATKRVEVVFEPARVSPGQIAAVLDEAGYPAAGS